jgi:hypothetical protein
VATKVFGSGGIEEQARKDIDELLSLPQKAVDYIARWIIESKNPIPFTWSDIQQIVEGTSLEPRVVDRVLILLRHLLSNWRIYGLTLDEIKGDLSAFGYTQEQVNRLGDLLAQLQDAKERVYRAGLKRSFEITAVPTIDDVNIVWDLRPVFEEFAYETEPRNNSYENLVTNTYVLLFEILASREDGDNKESATFQLSEDDFERLFRAFEKARRQLEVIKKKLLA